MESDAKAYEELNQPQYEAGCKFIDEMNLSPGAKVLDMGCGTGNLTKYIADIVGSCGQTVGIDPDVERIKIAQEKYHEIDNLQFHVGNSVTGFLNDNSPYYDVHVTMNAFHWFPHEHKKIYIQKAYQSLKSGGKLVILCFDKLGFGRTDQSEVLGTHYLTKDEMKKLFHEIGLFSEVVISQTFLTAHFKSYEIFKRWVKASTHHEIEELDPVYVKEMMAQIATFHDDGSIVLNIPCLRITAIKQ
ncbi:ubiquinone biosynthesis O-methyltransferase, mitochondrial-like [Dendronephthya gigantea]|uniref:ubiquinone biosynthesis O-methyltransferase, mitochondrial-like n=1 Tax=Dendronephthya gigantea TaxID=151771 RepID=UPI00106A1283|nr:ubiquinone biosynthesis O-methyltransferase, mitochondrial-like [Dendronephthya gigantea]